MGRHIETDAAEASRIARAEWRKRLAQAISAAFSPDDIRALCFHLGIDYEALGAVDKPATVDALIDRVERHDRAWQLVRRCDELRPNAAWEFPPPTIEDVDAFLADLSGLSEKTRDIYEIALRLFVITRLPIDADALKNFNDHLIKHKYTRSGAKYAYSKASRSLYVTALKKFMLWLDAHDRLPPWTCTKAVVRLKTSQGRDSRSGARHREPDPRLHEMISYYDDQPLPEGRDAERLRLELLRNRALLHCLWDSAARVSELLSLTRSQVADGQADRVRVAGKGDKERYLFFTPEAQAALRAYCNARRDPYPGLFISHRRDKGARLSRVSAWHLVKRAALGSGLRGMVSPHMIRHARATQLVNEGMPMESVQMVLGHDSIATTQTYYARMKVDVVKGQLDEYGLSPRQMRKVP